MDNIELYTCHFKLALWLIHLRVLVIDLPTTIQCMFLMVHLNLFLSWLGNCELAPFRKWDTLLFGSVCVHLIWVEPSGTTLALFASNVFLFLQNQSNRREMNNTLIEITENLQQNIKNNEDYVSGIVHDFRNPINCILAALDLFNGMIDNSI